MKTHFLLYILILVCSLLTGCYNKISVPIDLTGSWLGIVYDPENGTENMHVLYQIEQTDSGTYQGRVHRLDEGDMYNTISVEYENHISLKTTHSLPSEFCGVCINDSTLQGIYSILDYPWEITLKKISSSHRLYRSQYPYANDSYEVKFVKIPNPELPDVILDGELFLPKEGENHTAVVLVAGSGPLDKDETIAGHKIFWVLADYLATRDIAVLIYDKRGTHYSTGNYLEATTEDFASDARAAFCYLRDHKEIDKTRTGIAGHSEGSFIACMLAAQYSDIPFIISMAGMGVKMEEKIKQSWAYIKEKKEISKDDTAKIEEFNKKVEDIIGDTPFPIVLENLQDYVRDLLEEDEKEVPYLQYTTSNFLIMTVYPWIKWIMEYDLPEAIKKISCPIFVLNGDKDCHVVAEPNLAAFDSLLRINGNQHATITCYPDINHIFQHCETGLMHEYGLIEETFAPHIMEDIYNWINELP